MVSRAPMAGKAVPYRGQVLYKYWGWRQTCLPPAETTRQLGYLLHQYLIMWVRVHISLVPQLQPHMTGSSWGSPQKHFEKNSNTWGMKKLEPSLVLDEAMPDIFLPCQQHYWLLMERRCFLLSASNHLQQIPAAGCDSEYTEVSSAVLNCTS